MKTYYVRAQEMQFVTYEIKADSPDEARDRVAEGDGKAFDWSDSEFIDAPEEWRVTEVE